MALDKREYGMGTHIVSRQPWGIYVGGRAMCSDGVVRRLHTIAATADTFFSVPATVQVSRDGKRYTVAGYVTVETAQGYSTSGGPNDTDPMMVKFVAVQTGKNHHILPGTAWKAQDSL